MINYKFIADSINFYTGYNFKYVESPWTVTKAISDITRPPEAKDFQLKHEDNKVLVASGEQSFLYLYNKGFLPRGWFQTVTPCFRHDSFDMYHTKYFLKNELIITCNVNKFAVEQIIDIAIRFFERHVPDKKQLDIVKINDTQTDITYNKVEIGSYGMRSCEFLTWAYGTGLAEPRFSRVIGK